MPCVVRVVQRLYVDEMVEMVVTMSDADAASAMQEQESLAGRQLHARGITGLSVFLHWQAEYVVMILSL